MGQHNQAPPSVEMTRNTSPADKYEVTDAYRERLALVLSAVSSAVLKVVAKHGPNFASWHELYGVLLEEVDETWDEVKRNQHQHAARELLDVAAVTVRGLVQYMGLQSLPMPAEAAPTHPLSVPVSQLKKCLRSFSYEGRVQIADEARIHFAFLEAFTAGLIDTNNNLAPDQFKRVVVAGRKLFPGLFV